MSLSGLAKLIIGILFTIGFIVLCAMRIIPAEAYCVVAAASITFYVYNGAVTDTLLHTFYANINYFASTRDAAFVQTTYEIFEAEKAEIYLDTVFVTPAILRDTSWFYLESLPDSAETTDWDP